MVKAVVFDLDDTLYPEMQYVKSGLHRVSTIIGHMYNYSINEIYDDLIALFEIDKRNVFNRLLKQYKIDYNTGLILSLVNEYRNHEPLISYYNDVIPCITFLKKKSIKTGIITDGYVKSQSQKINKLKANYFFDEIIITDALGIEYRKPHPKAFEIMQNRFGVTFEEMIYVGDNPEKDFYIRNSYPIRTARIIRNGFYQNMKYKMNYKEDYSIYSLADLAQIIDT